MSNVPCGTCRLCCRGDIIMLFPDEGDVVDSYDHMKVETPSGSISMVNKGEDGNCVYLGPSGCTIHDRAPLICKAFDCRRMFLSKTRNERRAMVKAGIADAAVFEAGRQRLSSLSPGQDGTP